MSALRLIYLRPGESEIIRDSLIGSRHDLLDTLAYARWTEAEDQIRADLTTVDRLIKKLT